MKNIFIEVPPKGIWIHLTSLDKSTFGQAALITTDSIEIRLVKQPATKTPALIPAPEPQPKASAPTQQKAASLDLDAVLQRLIKLKPRKRATAINSIKAMFQFREPMDDQKAGELLEKLRKRGSLSIDEQGRIAFPPGTNGEPKPKMK